MIVAAAQLNSEEGDLEENLKQHYSLIEKASEHDVDLILFPEMSMTGYTRRRALELAFSVNDKRLSHLRKLSKEKQMIVIAGAPVRIKSKIYIGAFIVFPDKTIAIYTKQFLHDGEEEFFSVSFDYNPVITFENKKISLAICADIENPTHLKNAIQAKSTIYLASLFYSGRGIKDGLKKLSSYAKSYSINILMANYCGIAWGIESGGNSAFWNEKGELINKMDTCSTGLIIAEQKGVTWESKTYIQE